MGKTARRALIIVNTHKDQAQEYSALFDKELQRYGFETVIHAYAGRPSEKPASLDADVAISLGGDGTALYTARLTASNAVPILPVNLGTLGFIAWVRRTEWRERLADCVAGRLSIEERIMLDIRVRRGDAERAQFVALNDGVVSGAGIAKIIDLDVSIDCSPLGTYRSDGAIVATPTGSTAYSLAAGGPVISPYMDAMIFNPICPFALSNRPIVVPGYEAIEIFVRKEQRCPVMLTVDGQETFELSPEDSVKFDRSPHRTRIFGSGISSFYSVLRSKLNWSGGHDA